MQFLMALLIAVSGTWTYIPGGTWRPDAATVKLAQASLKPAVLKQAAADRESLPEWKSYNFQYQGREISGRKVVYVNAFCQPMSYADKELVQVLDGGPCFFFAIFDVATGKYASVAFNGRG
jgi:hypothetical protein